MPKRPEPRRALRFRGGLAGLWAVLAFLWPSVSPAVAEQQPLVIGLTSPSTGQYGKSGISERKCAIMAIEEFNARGGVLGRPITYIYQDVKNDAGTAEEVARRMIDSGVAFLIGSVNSDLARTISEVAQRQGVIFLNTNSSATTEAGRNCHRTKFVWDANAANFANSTVQYLIESVGRRWVLFTHDYVWGHTASAAVRRRVQRFGGEIVRNFLAPQDTRDFKPYLLRIKELRPDVVAAAIGGRGQTDLRLQVADLKMKRTPVWYNNQQDWPDVKGGSTFGIFGVFGTTWYYKLDLPEVARFVRRYRERYPRSRLKVPGNVCYNGYRATKALLGAVLGAGSTNNHAVIRRLEQLRVDDGMQHHPAYMNPRTHQLQQTVYIATDNQQPEDKSDLFRVLAWKSPGQARDDVAERQCVLEPFEQTPVFEP